ncbi:sodium:solute symporter [Opitutus sp. GAS368]|uniref:sodium:solute symporter n=1 Tax=Opitutus sp. GAS368 TaxID=1882749 RepID=UPI00087B0B7E|nr:sodium:solute symporter [Opitutus sp. GAS368]SDR86457.1 transporter, SSS family [Opitutus sp. GAS368]
MKIPPEPLRFLRTTGALLLALGCAALVGAAPLLPVRLTDQGSVTAGAGSQLAVVDGIPLVLEGGRGWRQTGANSWQELAWRPAGTLTAVFGDGQTAFALLADGPTDATQKVHQLLLTDGQLSSRPLPALPMPLRAVHGAVKDAKVFVHGTDQSGVSRLFVWSRKDGAPAWSAYAGIAAGRVEALVAQQDSLFAVVTSTDGTGQRLHQWSAGGTWIEASPLPGPLAAGAARAVGQAHILCMVGDGAARRIVTYYTVTRVWAELGQVAFAGIQPGAAWGNGFLLARAGDRQLTLSLVELVPTKLLLRPLDWVMIVLYLALIAGIGVYCFRREKKQSTASFFVGSRTIPFWAAGISLYATNSSSIGYIATTAKAFATNWQYLLGNIFGALGLMFVAVWIVPLLRRLELMSVFTYLDQRFHKSVRLAASAFCITMHMSGRLSVILFLPSLAIATITGLNVIWSIMIMGLVTIAYTALGGMRAVIWTDLAQVIVKVGGLIFAVGFIISRLHGGAGEFVATAMADDKMKMFDWSFDLTKATVWCFIFLTLLETVLTFPKDQILMQRVFTTKSEKEASRSVWVFAVMVIPASALFYLIGTGLYVFYHSHPERMNPLLPIDATFPLFIAAELPTGVTGLMIAGLFSAAMATSSSILNSVSTMVSVDFYEKIAKQPSQAFSIRLAEWVTVIAGLIGIGLAILLSRFSINSFLDTSIELVGLFGGAFGGAYTLGMFTRRANWQGVLIGMIVSFVVTFAVWWLHLVHPFLYLGCSILISIVVGYLASLFFPAPSEESIAGLTILTPKRKPVAGPA